MRAIHNALQKIQAVLGDACPIAKIAFPVHANFADSSAAARNDRDEHECNGNDALCSHRDSYNSNVPSHGVRRGAALPCERSSG